MSKAKPKFYLKIRSWQDAPFVSAWIVRQEGAAHAAVLWGEIPPDLASALAVALGLPVQREYIPLAGAQPMKPDRQLDLFDKPEANP